MSDKINSFDIPMPKDEIRVPGTHPLHISFLFHKDSLYVYELIWLSNTTQLEWVQYGYGLKDTVIREGWSYDGHGGLFLNNAQVGTQYIVEL